MEGLIQVPYEKVDLGETSYQIICKKIREETDLYIVLVYFTTDKDFNCNLYTTNIGKRIS